jgi:transposase-like protein
MKYTQLTSANENRVHVYQDVEVDYRAGVLSVSAVARKHGIADTTLRREALRRGWTRHTPEVRRQMVADALRGEFMASEVVSDAVHQHQVEAAAEDSTDLKKGLAVARKVLARLFELADQVDDPRDLKTVIDANKAAIDTIISVRSLIGPKQEAAALAMTVTDGFAELRAAFAQRLCRTVEPTDGASDESPADQGRA